MTAKATSRKNTAVGPVEGVILVHGPEPFFRSKALADIREAAESGPDEVDILELEPEGLDIRSLLDDLRTPALFAPKRLIIVERADKFISESAERLIEYARSPASNACLVLIATSLDMRRKGNKALANAARAIPCPSIKDYEVPKWCVQRAQEYGKRMAPGAARHLVDLAGSRLGELDGQIRNLAAYVKDRPSITEKDIEQLVGGDFSRRVWDLTDGVMNRDPATALRALDRLMREPGSSEYRLLSALAARWRDMLRAKQMSRSGSDADEIRRALGRHPYATKLILQAVARVSFDELAKKHQLLLQADLDVKSCPSRQRTWVVEKLVLELCGLRA